MTFIRNRRVVATIAIASCIAVPTTASASAGTVPSTYRTAGAQSGATAASAFPPANFHAGDTPADHPGASRARSAAPTAFHAGDTPADYPGASRARTAAPTRSRSPIPSALSCATSPRRSL